MKKKSTSLLLSFLVLAFLITILMPSCKKKEETPTQAKQITLQTFAEVLGKAQAETSGIADLQKTDQGLVVTYHLYLPQPQDFDALIGDDLAPKVEQLYKTFPSIDKVKFAVETPDPAETGRWLPYCAFNMTRKIYNQLNWTNLLARDLFKVCEVTYDR